MGGIISVIPAKRMEKAKSRIALAVSEKERIFWVKNLFHNTLNVVLSCKSISKSIVVTQDPFFSRESKRLGLVSIQEKSKGLNEAILEGCWEAARFRAEGVLIIPTDLPFINADELDRVIYLGKRFSKSVVVAPDYNKEGTNVLFLKPPLVIPPCFGEASFKKHIWWGGEKGAATIYYDSESLGFDLDTPNDLHCLKTMGNFK